MKIKTFEVGPFLENTYVLSKKDISIIVDPGFSNESEFQNLKDYLNTNSSKLIAVVLTHAHVDHILGLQRVLKEFYIPVYLNIDDLFLWENFGNQATMFGLNQIGFSFTPEALPNSGVFEVGCIEFECLYTPGHSPDHTSFYFKNEDILIVGDALFKESIGRTDLYKGDFELLQKSITEKLYRLPEETKVFPGHGEITTIGHEKINNPFVRA
jgi:glyoxylase-like metal-dependent hydrolase (beta-lactamase superfamily II)